MFKHYVVALAIVVSPTAYAQGQEIAPALDVSTSFAQQHERIRAEFDDGETYGEISPQQQADVQRALGRIKATLGEAGSVSELSAQERVDLMNDQEVVNTILTRAREDSRMVCKREKKVGSHRPTTQCFTVAERRRARELAQSDLERGQRTMNPLSN